LREYSVFCGKSASGGHLRNASYAISEMYALKILLGVLSGAKHRAGHGVFAPATPQVLYWAYISAIIGIWHNIINYATPIVVRCNTTLDDFGDRHYELTPSLNIFINFLFASMIFSNFIIFELYTKS